MNDALIPLELDPLASGLRLALVMSVVPAWLALVLPRAMRRG